MEASSKRLAPKRPAGFQYRPLASSAAAVKAGPCLGPRPPHAIVQKGPGLTGIFLGPGQCRDQQAAHANFLMSPFIVEVSPQY